MRLKTKKRRAKILIIEFADKTALLFHLKLTGQLIFNGMPGEHTRQVFNFSDGSQLFFNDIRKFGWIKVFSSEELEQELKDFGAILLSPPDKDNSVKKFHLCKQCYKILAKTFLKPCRWSGR